jgi:hypothetical protein
LKRTFWERRLTVASFYDFAVCFLIYTLFIPAIHEAGHWLASKYLLGIDGVIRLGFPMSTFTPNSALPHTVYGLLVYFAGGDVVFLAYLLLFSRETQIEEKAGMAPAIVQQLIYGTGEGVWAMTGFNMAFLHNAVLVSEAAYGIVAAIGLYFIYKHWRTLPTIWA